MKLDLTNEQFWEIFDAVFGSEMVRKLAEQSRGVQSTPNLSPLFDLLRGEAEKLGGKVDEESMRIRLDSVLVPFRDAARNGAWEVFAQLLAIQTDAMRNTTDNRDPKDRALDRLALTSEILKRFADRGLEAITLTEPLPPTSEVRSVFDSENNQDNKEEAKEIKESEEKEIKSKSENKK